MVVDIYPYIHKLISEKVIKGLQVILKESVHPPQSLASREDWWLILEAGLGSPEPPLLRQITVRRGRRSYTGTELPHAARTHLGREVQVISKVPVNDLI